MKGKLIAAAVGASLMLSGASFAASQPVVVAHNANHFYVNAFGGPSFMNDTSDTFSGSNLKLDKSSEIGYDVGGAVGYKIQNFRVEGALSYIRNDVDNFKYAGIKLDGIGGYTSLTTLMANGYYDFTQWSRTIVPYIGAGLGGAYIKENITSSGHTAVKGHDTVFAYQGIAGVGYYFTPQVELSLDYRYLGTQDATLDAKDSAGNKGTVKEGYSTSLINLGLTYHFN